ncbi:MAG TPA: O-methyltransferase [Polyangiaceae bacterium]|nr:O-methyltransferase [Polyangiaceae bacterium]
MADLVGPVDDFIVANLVTDDFTIDAADLPAIQVSRAQGKLLMLLAQSVGARRILEVGTLAGYSAIWLARSLPDGGELVTLELDAHHADVAKKNIERAGFAKKVSVVVGPAIESLKSVKGPIDFAFIDADKANNPRYFARAVELARPGALVIVDNVVRGGKVIDAASDDANVKGTRELFETVSRDARVSATAIQTTGEKGWDGFLLARVR